MASADYASFVIFKTRDVCFAGSLVKHQLSMSIAFSISLFISVVQVRFYFKKLLRQQNIPLTSGGFFLIILSRLACLNRNVTGYINN